MPVGGQCKGNLFVHLHAYVAREKGEAAWRELLAHSSPDDRKVLESLVLSGSWYPVGIWNRALLAFFARHHPGALASEAEMRKIAAYVADHDLNGAFKMILRLGSPSFLLRRTDSLWSRYFDSGRFRWEEEEPRRFKLTLESSRPNEMPDRFTCDQGVCAWIEMGLALTGAKGKVRHLECRLVNGSRCVYSATW